MTEIAKTNGNEEQKHFRHPPKTQFADLDIMEVSAGVAAFENYKMDNAPKTQFTTMLYNGKNLVIKTIEGKNPVVIAECFLPEMSAQICQLLTDAAETDSTLDNAQSKITDNFK